LQKGYFFEINMRTLFSICLLFAATACVAQENADTALAKPTNHDGGGRAAVGTIVHLTNKNCRTVIRYIDPTTKDTMVYLPMGDAIKPYDKVGTTISFTYRRSLIRQPFGCTGMPVMISNIKVMHKVKHHKKPTDRTPAAK